jgi:hypothetical protein
MPEKETLRRAARDKRQGKSASTQAGEFVREEIHHVREGKHGARSSKQVVAIGLSKARRAGVDLPAPKRGARETRENARRARQAGQAARHKTSPKRSRAMRRTLRGEGTSAASKRALSRQGRSGASHRSRADRSSAAKKAARTKGPARSKAAARMAARTRAKNRREQSAS